MLQERDKCRNWSDTAIHNSVKRAIQHRTSPGQWPSEFTEHMYCDEHEALLAGAILYLDSLAGIKSREPEIEPVDRERKITHEL